ncbi:MAG: UDP-N-acetylmuramoyl-L-alanine--D-glutamate ligase [Kiritimatiellia bacterium]
MSARYDHRTVLILGAGRSGRAAARLVLARGGRPTIVDEQWQQEVLAAFACEGISCMTANRDHLPDGSFDLVITSPSIPLEHPWIVTAYNRGLSVISELEFGAAYWQGTLFAITGSKGKSSVVKCLTDTLVLAGFTAVTAGNYGTPLCERVLTCELHQEKTIAVVEVSSFQMEHTRNFAPRFAAILNIQADHLDRHHTMETYVALKYKLFQAQCAGRDYAFLPIDLPDSKALPQGVALERFGMADSAEWRYEAGKVFHQQGEIAVTGYFDNRVLGSAAALIAAMLTRFGLSSEQIATGFASFIPLPHRMQKIGEWNGITFIDDSKATTLAATNAALIMAGKEIRLIAGGLLKESDLNILDETLRARVRKVYLIGATVTALFNAWKDVVPCECCNVMSEAVQRASTEANAGDTILLSPGTASFDQYTGMAARGDDFHRCFEHLPSLMAPTGASLNETAQ